MSLSEKFAYLNGLISGLSLDETKKDTKVINNLVSLLEEMVKSVSDLESTVEEMRQQLDAVDEDLGEIEKDLYEDDTHDHPVKMPKSNTSKKDDNEIYFEVTCPTCGDTIHLDDDIISRNEIDCPNCGEKLEFDLEG